MDPEDFRQSLQADLAEFLDGSGLAANATGLELRDTSEWPPSESGRDFTVSDFSKYGLEAPTTTPESPRWRSYTALWDSAERRLIGEEGLSPESVATRESLVRAIRRRLHALVARRDDQPVSALLDVAYGDVSRWAGQVDDEWVGYTLEGLDVAEPQEIVRDSIEFDGDELYFDGEFLPPQLVMHRTEGIDDNQMRKDLKGLIDLARLVTRAPIRRTAKIVFREGLQGAKVVSLEPKSERDGCWLPSRTLTRDDAVRVSTLWVAWQRNRKLLEAPTRAYMDAILAPTQYHTVAWCIAALEGALKHGLSKDDAEAKRVTRATRIISSNRSDQEKVRTLIGACYRDVRNPTFHADSFEVIEDGVAKAAGASKLAANQLAKLMLQFASYVILDIVKALGSGHTLKSYFDEIDARRP